MGEAADAALAGIEAEFNEVRRHGLARHHLVEGRLKRIERHVFRGRRVGDAGAVNRDVQ